MKTQTEALKSAIEFAEYCLEELDLSHMASNQAKRLVEKAKEALAQPEQEKERCVGCEACIDTACGRDECPKGWPKAAQPEQEPVAWMRDDEMKAMVAVEKMAWIEGGRRDLIEDYNKPLYKRPWEDAGVPYTVVECNCSGKTTLFSPPQRRPLTDEQRMEICNAWWDGQLTASQIIDMVEAAHGIKE